MVNKEAAAASDGSRRQLILSSISAGMVMGILIVFFLISFAALIFSGSLDPFLYTGIGVIMVGALILILYVTLRSSIPFVVTLPQDAPAVISAALAAAIAASMSGRAPQMVQGTIFAAIIISSICTGIFYWLLGRFNLGRLVRFIPYPVVGGFLAGTGWLMVLGGITIMARQDFSAALFQPQLLLRWLPGFLFAVVIFVLARRISHFLLMPALLLSGIGLFYLFFVLSGGSVAAALNNGWLLGPFPDGNLFQPVVGLIWTNVDWQVVLQNSVLMMTLLLVSAISYLLNISGLEISLNRNIDLNHELRSTGIANILGGLGGAFPGYTSVSLTTLAERLGGRSRAAGFTIALIVTITLLLGAGFLGFFPRIVPGAIVIYVGFLFLLEWLYEAYFKLTLLEYILIWLILIIIAAVGYLEGVLAGLLIASIFFVINYSRIDVTRHRLWGSQYQSHVMRPPVHQRILKNEGNTLIILKLQGYIFFGSANNFLEQVKSLVESKEGFEIKYILLDFRLVSDVDSSALLTFKRLLQLLQSKEIKLLVTNMESGLANSWQREVLMEHNKKAVLFFPELDLGVAWCEQQILDQFFQEKDDILPANLFNLINDELAKQERIGDREPVEEDQAAALADMTGRLAPFVEHIEVQEGQHVLNIGDEGQGIFFVQSGQFLAKSSQHKGRNLQFRTMETGTVFGEISVYSDINVTADVIAGRHSVLLKITKENLRLMEKEDPALAFALHRIVAANLAEKLAQTSNTLVALQS